MSVNAVNAAEPQQKGNPIASALATGVGLGAVAGGVGYYVGNKRPDLDKVFAMPQDKFEAATKEAAEDLKADIEKIAAGRKEYAEAGAEHHNTLNKKIMERAEMIKDDAKVAPDNLNALKDEVGKTKVALGAKQLKLSEEGKELSILSNVKEKRAEWIKAKNELAAITEDGETKTNAQTKLNKALEELNKAKEDRKAYYNDAKAEFDNYVKAERDLVKAKDAKYDALKANEGEAKTLSEAIEKAKADLKEARTSKLNELTDKQQYKDAFAKIKKLFPKEGGKKIGLIAAGIAAAVGLIAGYAMGNNKQA